MGDFEIRNRHFDRLFSDPGLMWMGQNTNHVPMHPKVREAAVYSVPDERLGEVPVGYVLREPGVALDEAALLLERGTCDIGTLDRARRQIEKARKRTGERALARAQSLVMTGRLRDALAALDQGVDPEQAADGQGGGKDEPGAASHDPED